MTIIWNHTCLNRGGTEESFTLESLSDWVKPQHKGERVGTIQGQARTSVRSPVGNSGVRKRSAKFINRSPPPLLPCVAPVRAWQYLRPRTRLLLKRFQTIFVCFSPGMSIFHPERTFAVKILTRSPGCLNYPSLSINGHAILCNTPFGSQHDNKHTNYGK